jgi:translation initiation factor 5
MIQSIATQSMPSLEDRRLWERNQEPTLIPNITDVALKLHGQSSEVNKFFGTELGAQTTYNANTDRAIVNGKAHPDGVLQDMIHRYIEKFALFSNCGLPETEFKI